MSNPAAIKVMPIASLQRRGASLVALEKRYVFDAAIATELHSLIDGHTQVHAVETPASSHGDAFVIAAQQFHATAAPGHADAVWHGTPAVDPLRDTHLLADITKHNAAPTNHQIAFIDSSVPDIATLVADIPAGTKVVLIDHSKDGVAQMVAALQGQQGVKAIHILSHGAEGHVALGSSVLDEASMSTIYRSALTSIHANLAVNADILVYGCNFGAGTDGVQATRVLANLTGATVAASTNATGATSLGGDWVLETKTGALDVATISASDWNHDLVTITPSDAGATGFVNKTTSGNLVGHATATAPVVPITFAIGDASGNPILNGGGTTLLDTPVATAHGSVVMTDAATGAYVYTPNAGYAGNDQFTFAVTAVDPVTGPAYGSAFVNIVVAHEQIVLQNDTAHSTYDQVAGGGHVIMGTLVPTDVVKNPTGATLTYAVTKSTAHGMLAFKADGTYTYTPNKGYAGTDTFTWSATDATGVETGATAKVTITIDPPPLVSVSSVNSAYLVTTGGAGDPVVTLPLAGHYTEATAGATVTFSSSTSPAHGTVSYDNVNGTFTYTPNPGYVGSDPFNILATDSNGYTAIIAVNPQVTANGHALPGVSGDTQYVTEGYTLSNVVPNRYEVDSSGVAVSGGTIAFQAPVAGFKGVFTDNGNGTYNYAPSAGPTGLGTYKVPYTWTDPFGQTSGVGYETIVVSPPPLATAGVVKYAAVGAPVALNLDTQSSHSSNDPWVTSHLTYAVTAPPLHGTLAADPANPLGGLIYTPNKNFSGVDTFTYSVFDGYNTVSAADTIVSPAHIFASADTHVTPQNTAYSNTVASISGSPSGGSNWSLTTGPKHGTVSLKADGSYTYTPTNGYAGLDQFSYKLTDSTNHTARNNVFILMPSTRVGAEVPPTSTTIPDQANHDSTAPSVDVSGSFKVLQPGAKLSYFAAGLPNGLTINQATGVIGGTIDHLASQDITNGQYTVTVYADDGNGGVTQQTFTWTVVNDNPAAVNHSYTTPYNTAVSGNASVGASDPNTGDVLNFTQTTTPLHGSVVFNADGTYLYKPSSTFAGTDSFDYTVDDGKGGSIIRTETITITPPKLSAANDTYSTPFNTALAGKAATGDVFVSGSKFASTSTPLHGGVVMNSDGTYTYTPTKGFSGSDSFTYQITDPTGAKVSATEFITILPQIGAVNDSYTTKFNTQLMATAAAGDTFAAGSAFTAISAPSHGTVVMKADGSYTYTPTTGYAGTDTFQYQITDPSGQVVTAVETITVGKPTLAAINHSLTGIANFGVAGNASTGDSYAPGATFSVNSVPSHGTVIMKADGTYSYVPAKGFVGTDTFTYLVSDTYGQTTTATETIVVGPPIPALQCLTTFGNFAGLLKHR